MKIAILLISIVLVPGAIISACLRTDIPTARLIAYAGFPAIVLLGVFGHAAVTGRSR